MSNDYNASEIDRLVREGTEDNEWMNEAPWSVGNADRRVTVLDADHTWVALLEYADGEEAAAIVRTRNNLPAMVAQLSAAKAEVDKLRGEIAMLLANADADTHLMTDAIRDRDRLAAEVERLTNERDAYRKAKQENDERFMIERNEAQTECERLAGERDRLSARVRELELTEEDRETLAMLRSTIEIEGRYGSKMNRALAVLDRLVKGGR